MSSAPPPDRWRFLVSPRWLAWHGFMLVTAVGMLWLGDWQLHRAESGNSLSWAYTFEWPLFAIFRSLLGQDDPRRGPPSRPGQAEGCLRAPRRHTVAPARRPAGGRRCGTLRGRRGTRALLRVPGPPHQGGQGPRPVAWPPVRLPSLTTKAEAKTVTFSNWGAPFTVTAPAQSVPYAQVTS